MCFFHKVKSGLAGGWWKLKAGGWKLMEILIFLLWLSGVGTALSDLIITFPTQNVRNVKLESLHPMIFFSPPPHQCFLFLEINCRPSKHPISVKTINQSYCWVLPQTFPKNNLPRAIFYGRRCFIAKRGKHVFAEMGNSTRPTNPINDMNGTLAHIYGQNYHQHHHCWKPTIRNSDRMYRLTECKSLKIGLKLLYLIFDCEISCSAEDEFDNARTK